LGNQEEKKMKPRKIRKIKLTAEKRTLLITLFAKAADYQSKNSILKDRKAYEIASRFDVDLAQINESSHNEVTVVRAKQLDDWLSAFIKKHRNCAVLNLGCGLDSRVMRIHPPSTVRWFDVDYPVVINLRKRFFSNKKNYHMVSSSITESRWLERIPAEVPAIIVADGVLEYLTEAEVKQLLNRVTQKFPHGQIAFDVMNSFAQNMGREELQRTMGAVHKWAVDDLVDVDKLDPDLKRMKAMSVFESKHIKKVTFKDQVIYDRSKKLDPKIVGMLRLLLYRF
jgi:O-methyltransferase involved in polyketide biosynthesis